MLTIRTRPNRHTVAAGAILFAMWYAGAAQGNGAAYVLMFLVAALLLVSFLHARQQLRGVEVRAGSVPPLVKGQQVRLPLTLTVGSGKVPSGVEVTSAMAQNAVFVGQLSLESPTQVSLQIRPSSSGGPVAIPVVLRSRYPLGFFTTEAAVNVGNGFEIHPEAKGSLELPEPVGYADDSSGARRAAGLGDDFNGLRNWVPGDSLNHVDWRGLARERPMMVKEFTGGAAPVVALDWEMLDLPATERAGQLAKWIEQCEIGDEYYSLAMPGEMVPAGRGTAHQRRCLTLLASAMAGHSKGDASQQADRWGGPEFETQPAASGKSLVLLTAAIALVALTLLGSVPWSSIAVFLLSLAVRWWRGERGAVPQSGRLIFLTLGAIGIFAELGTLLGLEAGMGFIIILTGGKISEARSPRDLQILALLGWFLCLCGLVIEQSLTRSLQVIVVAVIIAFVLTRVRRGVEGLVAPLRTVATLLLQALPLIAVMFFFFPRGSFGLVTALGRSFQNTTGLTDDVNPGSVARVAESDAPAFRAAIPETEAMDPASLYWRCLTLTECRGLRWVRTQMRAAAVFPRTGLGIRQTLAVEPHGLTWLPALDAPSKIVSGGRQCYIDQGDSTLRSYEPLRFGRRFEVESMPFDAAQPIPPGMRRACLAVGLLVPEDVLALARSWTKGGKSDEQIMEAGLDHFGSGEYRYTLEPGEYGDDALREFLFERKVGFCEHYAAAFGTLMRLAGVPTRLVVGYQGGESFGDYLMVRQYNAHVWAEVYLEGKGWTRADPTARLAPARLRTDFRQAMADSFSVGFTLPRDTWWGGALLQAQIAWDMLNYRWFTKVVQFNELEQTSLLSDLGFSRLRSVAGLFIGGLGIVLLGLWLWIRRASRHPDPAVRLWLETCRRLRKRGIHRSPTQPALSFAAEHEQAVPGLLKLAELYNLHRYGGTAVNLSELKDATRQLHKSLSQLRS